MHLKQAPKCVEGGKALVGADPQGLVLRINLLDEYLLPVLFRPAGEYLQSPTLSVMSRSCFMPPGDCKLGFNLRRDMPRCKSQRIEAILQPLNVFRPAVSRKACARVRQAQVARPSPGSGP